MTMLETQNKTAPDAGGESKPIRVLCVDDVPDVIYLVEKVIKAEAGMVCVGCIDTAEGLAERAKALEAHVILLDATMPGKRPLEALRDLSASYPEAKTLMFSGLDDAGWKQRAQEAGAVGWVSKGADMATVLRAVREVAAGGQWWKPAAWRGDGEVR